MFKYRMGQKVRVLKMQKHGATDNLKQWIGKIGTITYQFKAGANYNTNSYHVYIHGNDMETCSLGEKEIIGVDTATTWFHDTTQ